MKFGNVKIRPKGCPQTENVGECFAPRHILVSWNLVVRFATPAIIHWIQFSKLTHMRKTDVGLWKQFQYACPNNQDLNAEVRKHGRDHPTDHFWSSFHTAVPFHLYSHMCRKNKSKLWSLRGRSGVRGPRLTAVPHHLCTDKPSQGWIGDWWEGWGFACLAWCLAPDA